MTTEKQELEKSTINIEMAFEKINRLEKVIFDRPTSEENEKRKHQASQTIISELFGYSPEDRLDIFNSVRAELENNLKQQVEEMAYEIEDKHNYFEKLKKIVY